MAVVPWMLTVYVARVGRARSALGALLGRRWDSLGRAAGDLGLAVGCALLIRGSEHLFAASGDAQRTAAVLDMLPHTPLERAAWVLVAVSVGFGEEVVYRGYLKTQLTAFTKRPWLGLGLQAALFGLAHVSQGPASAIRIGAYGLLLGAVAGWRRSLLPVIAAHVALDVASGWG